jgi:hypothetical protein
MAAAADIALFLLTASMAAWDAQHKPQMQPQQQGSSQPRQSQDQLQQPVHNTRVMVLTGLPNSSNVSAAHAAEQLRQLDDQTGQQIRSMYHALANKAASLDIPIGGREQPGVSMADCTAEGVHPACLLPSLRQAAAKLAQD